MSKVKQKRKSGKKIAANAWDILEELETEHLQWQEKVSEQLPAFISPKIWSDLKVAIKNKHN